MPTVHLVIKGKVQDVFYRASSQIKAKSLGITGWVKNTDEGHVELLGSGSTEDIEALITWCKQGPPQAIVTDVIITSKDEVEFRGFEIIE